MSDEKRNGRLSLANVLTIVGMLGALVGVWVTVNVDAADTKRRVDTVEKRQIEDRAETKSDVKEVKQDIKDVKNEVQAIRILLERMGRERGQR